MNMIETVAKAIEAKPIMCGTYTLSGEDAVNIARAAIEAMKAPTKEMIEAGYIAMDEGVDFYSYDSDSGYYIEATGGADVWKAMISKALEGGE